MNAARGVAAGAAGAVALVAFDRCEALILGRPAVYAPAAITRRLAWLLSIQLAPATAKRAGMALRAAYATVLGVLYVDAPGGPLARPLAFGVALALAEAIGLPGTGATPPLRAWSRGERALLFGHAVAFAVVAQLALCALRRSPATSQPRTPPRRQQGCVS